jgi:glycerol-3-phosphate acyltransferase PlsX
VTAPGPIRIALDGMGGDHAPAAPVTAALTVAAEGIEVLLTGDAAVLREELGRQGAADPAGVEVIHAPERIGSSEDGARAVRAKPDSSVAVACRLAGEGRAQGAVSAGHTGAMLAAATLHMRRARGVLRPGIAVVAPSASGPVVLIDVGANAEARPEHLRQFALMGRLFARDVLGVAEPRVGLLSIGEEAEKGNELVRTAHALLADTPGFIGNVEGRDIPGGAADVVVTDGFTGNVVLKLYEGAASYLLREVRAAVSATLVSRIGGLLVRPSLRRMRERTDPNTFGGAYLLGVRGLAVIGHGNATPVGIANAVRLAARGAREGLVEQFAAALASGDAEPASAT